MFILGISAFYHDSAACLINNDDIIMAVQEERFTRKKHDHVFPTNSIIHCLNAINKPLTEIDYICFYEKPFLKFERLIETYLNEIPMGFQSFRKAIPTWIKDKLLVKKRLVDELACIHSNLHNTKSTKKLKKLLASKLLFSEHHLSHAGSCYFPSPYNEAAILTMDGVGEWLTTSIAFGQDNNIKFLKEIRFPHSIGLFYSTITSYLGFKVNSGEYKVMGLSPYGEPKYTQVMKDNLIEIKDDGSFKLNMDYFNYPVGLTMMNKSFCDLFNKKPRVPESKITLFEMDMARSAQKIVEEVVIKLAHTAKKITGSNNLVLAGGVALNCVGNGKILKENIFKNIWIQPAAGDAGGALGAAYSAYYIHLNNRRSDLPNICLDRMQGAFLGVQYNNLEVESSLNKLGAKYHKLDFEDIVKIASEALSKDKVIGWHQGKMEFGPRALGARSILGNPCSPKMQSIMNMKIKFRESFRPFAPVVTRENLTDYFEISDVDSPYMLLVAPVHKNLRKDISKENQKFFGIDKLNLVRSDIPAVTHVDYSARIQTVDKHMNPKFYNLIKAFGKLTGYNLLINTSFNVRGEPIVCSPEDSYNCFMRTNIDILIIENFILYKNEQTPSADDDTWKQQYRLD